MDRPPVFLIARSAYPIQILRFAAKSQKTGSMYLGFLTSAQPPWAASGGIVTWFLRNHVTY
ncbi:MAG TPA: hypothetical protein H9936_07630, partial [Candidatus Agathobaculum intestinigallinarum]|nr:hypothetical protein [Candidatus Agathobaculum intestinigallinarum]